MKVSHSHWESINLAEYARISTTLGPKAKQHLRREIPRLRDCARALRARHTSSAVGATAKQSYRCGLRGCLNCRRRKSEARFERLAARLPRIPARTVGAACTALRDLQPRIANAEASARRHAGTPLAVRQQRHLAALLALDAELQAAESFSWHFITVKLPYDPRAESDLMVGALRRRANLCKQIEEHLHSALFAAAMLPAIPWVATVECGRHGLVHVHILYRGPTRKRRTIRAAAQQIATDPDVEVSEVPDDEVRRTLRYVTKPDGMKAETWHAFKCGERCKVPNPALDAHFTAATRGIHTRTTRGLFRNG